MPWNEPGGNGNDPWGNKQGNGPPNLDKLLGDFLKKINSIFQGKSNNANWRPSMNQELGFIAGCLAVIVVIGWAVSGLFIVNPAEQAVVLRFGKYYEVQQPGLHWYARFIDSKYLIDVQKIYSFSIEGDFLTKSADQSDLSAQQAVPVKVSDASDQSKNLVNVELSVQYRIGDARDYLFNVVNPDDTIQEVAAGALSDVVGKMKLDDVLTTGRETLSDGVRDRIKQAIAPYNAGLEVITVTLRKVQAPDQVKAAFNDVNRADQDKATTIQQAQAYASKVVPIAQGDAARTLADASAYKQQLVLQAQANISKYQALLFAYKSSPDITRQRMYIETMQNILQNTTKVLMDANSGNNLIYLPLDKLVRLDSEENAAKTNNINLLPAPFSNGVKHDAN